MSLYLDHNASSPLRQAALQAMLPFLTEQHGNASSAHAWGTRARCAVEEARVEVSMLLGCRPGEVVFTSGGTESNNTAVRGASGRIVSTPIEHASVLEPLAARHDVEVDFVAVDAYGRVDLDRLRQALRRPTALVSVGWANSEIGTVQDIAAVASICREVGVPVHVDAVQAVGKIPVDVRGLDLVSVSAHKLGGPQGVGALYVKAGRSWPALLLGGGQERERRSGTENVAGIVGFGEACRLRRAELVEWGIRVAALRDRLWTGLQAGIDGIQRDGASGSGNLPNTLHVRVDGIRGEVLVASLDLRGIGVSSGSACAAGSAEPSHVLRAIGLGEDAARDGVRFSLGPEHDEEAIDRVIAATVEAVAAMRAVRAVA